MANGCGCGTHRRDVPLEKGTGVAAPLASVLWRRVVFRMTCALVAAISAPQQGNEEFCIVHRGR